LLLDPFYWIYLGTGRLPSGPYRRRGADPIYQAQPLPSQTPPTTPQPFPKGPAANEPWPDRRSFPKLPDWITRAPITPQRILLETGRAVLEHIREQDKERERRERENARQMERRRMERNAPLPEIELPAPRPERAPAPDPVKVPRPGIFDFPDFPPQSPAVTPFPEVPISIPIPDLFPEPIAIPRPTPPIPAPVARPSSSPLIEFAPQLLPEIRPSALPRIESFPVGDFLGDVQGLTPIEPRGVGSLSFAPDAVPSAQQAQEQCQVVKRRRRRKGKCREGFFVERPGETKFTTWRERDCDFIGRKRPRLVR